MIDGSPKESLKGRFNTLDGWDKAGYIFLFIFVTADLVSISVAQIAAFGMIVSWIAGNVKNKRGFDLSPLKWPLAFFVVASLVAALFSLDVVESIRDSKDLLHIAIFFSAYELLRRWKGATGITFRLLAFAGMAVSCVGLYQAISRGIVMHDRISGFFDIYMTFAGMLALVITVSLATIFFDYRRGKDSWIFLALLLTCVAVLLSLTRNAWIGIMVGATILIVLKRPKALFVLPVVAILAFYFSPEGVQNRIRSVVDLENETNRERILLWSAGVRIVADNPVLGVGQNSFPLVYPKYRSPDVNEPSISHLHNNFLEIAAERGLLGLVAWSSFWIYALCLMAKALFANREYGARRAALAGAFASLVAFQFAGIFEYNFGDSEIQMLFYYLLAVGVAAIPDKLKVYNEDA